MVIDFDKLDEVIAQHSEYYKISDNHVIDSMQYIGCKLPFDPIDFKILRF